MFVNISVCSAGTWKKYGNEVYVLETIMSNNLSRAWSQATSCHLEEIMQRKQKTKGIFNEIQCCILQKMSHLLLKNAKGHKCDSQREPWNEKKIIIRLLYIDMHIPLCHLFVSADLVWLKCTSCACNLCRDEYYNSH